MQRSSICAGRPSGAHTGLSPLDQDLQAQERVSPRPGGSHGREQAGASWGVMDSSESEGKPRHRKGRGRGSVPGCGDKVLPAWLGLSQAHGQPSGAWPRATEEEQPGGVHGGETEAQRGQSFPRTQYGTPPLAPRCLDQNSREAWVSFPSPLSGGGGSSRHRALRSSRPAGQHCDPASRAAPGTPRLPPTPRSHCRPRLSEGRHLAVLRTYCVHNLTAPRGTHAAVCPFYRPGD